MAANERGEISAAEEPAGILVSELITMVSGEVPAVRRAQDDPICHGAQRRTSIGLPAMRNCMNRRVADVDCAAHRQSAAAARRSCVRPNAAERTSHPAT